MSLRYYGDPVLLEKAKPVEKITAEIRELVRIMIDIMNETRGVGLAAPQVGVSLRLFISNIDFEDDNGEVHLKEPDVYINPILSNPSSEMIERGEGCLSVPGLYLPVARPLSVTIEALDLEGKPFKKECSRYLARCMFHENDHLDGILFIERIPKKMRLSLEGELKKIKNEWYKKRAQ